MDFEEQTSQSSTPISPATHTFYSLAPLHLSPAPNSGSKTQFLQPGGSARINFFSLPCEIRKKIYERVLIVAHPVYLFQEPGSRVETFVPDKPFRWLSLLHTNCLIHSETIPVLYGMNNFCLVDTTPQQVGLLKDFLNCIGSVNAGLLSHLCINFPVTEHIVDQPGKVKLRDDSLQTLKLLRERCINLTTLETLIHRRNSKGLVVTEQASSQFIQDGLSQFNSQLKAISSLNKVIVRVHEGTPTPSVLEMMQGLGWIVRRGQRNQ
ncbi:hypothetical protein MMC32_005871 [Xylographa parallela]|nr:hypothetical protein [Xylographa parallela]